MKKIVSIVLVCLMIAAMLPFGVFADAGVVEIDTAEEFMAIEDNLGGNYKLTADITLTDLVSYKEESKLFTGTLDGDGHTITVNFEGESARSGLFCSVGGCTIKNLTVTGSIKASGNSASALIGTVKGTDMVTIENVTVDVDVNVPSDNGQGGLIGVVEDVGANVTIKGCTNKGDITGNKAGGLLGYVESATVVIEDSVNEGTITNPNEYGDYRGAGGLIGVLNQGTNNVTIKNCENKGDVTANYIPANAYVGHNNAGTFNVEGSSNTGKVISGGYELPAATATAKVAGIWGGADFNLDIPTGKLTGSANFHALPALTGYTAYICGAEATDKVTVAEVTGGDRQVDIAVDASAAPIDGFASVTIVWSDGTYSTFGSPAPKAADYEAVNDSAAILATLTDKGTTVNADSVSAESPFLADGQTNPHGSEKNLFDADNTNKYEGWKTYGVSTVISFELTEAVKVGYYALGTGGDDANYPSRQPNAWKLWGSVDGEEYVVLDDVTDGDLPNFNNTLVVFEVDTDVAYKFFKLEIVSVENEANITEGYSYSQLGEIKIYKACEHDWENVTVEATCTENGSSTDTCSLCGKVVSTEIEAEGHNFVDGVCSVCGEEEGNAPTTTAPSTTTAPTTSGTPTTSGAAGTTAAPSTTTAPTTGGNAPATDNDTPKTGDGMVVALVLVVVTLAGVALFTKKRATH